MKILVLNSGSSSQKVCLYEIGDALPEDPPRPVWEGRIEWNGDTAAITVRNSKGIARKETLKVCHQSGCFVGALNPGNFGTYEGGNMLIAKMFGVAGTSGLTLALCRRARTVFWAGVGAMCMIAMKKADELGTIAPS